MTQLLNLPQGALVFNKLSFFDGPSNALNLLQHRSCPNIGRNVEFQRCCVVESYLQGNKEIVDRVESPCNYKVNGCLSYFDKVLDGFYLIRGVDSYVWTMCTDVQENGRIPSMESLKSVDPRIESSIEVALIDRRTDPSLKELHRVLSISSTCITTEEVVGQLAKLVCNRMW